MKLSWDQTNYNSALKYSIMKSLFNIILTMLMVSFSSCQHSKSQEVHYEIPAEFKSYWYAGEAEIITFKLQQSRYGELREGSATLIYVTEDFVPEKQVKADRFQEGNTSVLKLNTVKKFVTGIYPYSTMQSTFMPLEEKKQHALKVTSGVQEWCGQVFMQLNNREQFDIKGYSYFESQGDISKSLPKEVLENELWCTLRIDPKQLPVGEFQSIPSFEYLQLKHKPVNAYKAVGTLKQDDITYSYILDYPELDRKLTITFMNTFPYIIQGWTEQNGTDPKTVAKRITSKMLPYWSKNSNADQKLRKEFGLP